MSDERLLQRLVVPVNSAVHWARLYADDPPPVVDLRDPRSTSGHHHWLLALAPT